MDIFNLASGALRNTNARFNTLLETEGPAAAGNFAGNIGGRVVFEVAGIFTPFKFAKASKLRAADEIVFQTDDFVGVAAGRKINQVGGTHNCVSCSIAGDASLAGRPASALNNALNGRATNVRVLEEIFGNKFKNVGGRAEIARLLERNGSGAQGIVFGSRGLDTPGHVFNAVNQNGNIRFIDFQTGRTASFDGFERFFFLRTN